MLSQLGTSKILEIIILDYDSVKIQALIIKLSFKKKRHDINKRILFLKLSITYISFN